MKITYFSDSHREKGKQPHDLILPENTDVLVLAGDIGMSVEAITWIIETFGSDLPIVYVPGNHEFYRDVYQHVLIRMREEANKHPNLHLLLNETVEIDGWTFIGSTAWTDFDLNGNQPMNMMYARALNDFGEIKWREPGNSYRDLTPEDTLRLNLEARFFIWEELRKRDVEKCIVVTHHAPTELSILPEFERDPKNAAYVNNWGRRIAYDLGPKFWFHGHTHGELDYEIGDTRVICNPIGYPGQFAGRQPKAIDV